MNNIIDKLKSYNIKEVNNLLDELFASDNIDTRMELCECIIDSLLFHDIDVDDIEDSIKSLVLN